MKKKTQMTMLFCAILIVGSGLAAIAQNRKEHSSERMAPSVAVTHVSYHRLSNGTIVYEEYPAGSVSMSELSPAAGGGDTPLEDAGTAPRMKYDPLTQTYRRISVDSQGNKHQNMINSPR